MLLLLYYLLAALLPLGIASTSNSLGSSHRRVYYGAPLTVRSTVGCITADGRFVRRLTKEEQREMEINKREMEEYEERVSVALGNSDVAALAHMRKGPVFPEYCGGLESYLEFVKKHCRCNQFG